MNSKIYLWTLAAGMAVTATAQQPLTFSHTTDAVRSEGIQMRHTGLPLTSMRPAGQTFTTTTLKVKNTVPVARVMKAGDTDNPYGTAVILLEEDFSKMATGSIEAPDLETNINYAEGEEGYTYPWWNVKPEYTAQPHWGSHYAYPAGGCVFLNADMYNQQAQLNMPLVNASGNCNITTLQFKARTLSGTSNGLWVECAETRTVDNVMGKTWDILGGVTMPEVTSEWQVYEATFYGTGPTTLFNIVQQMQGPIYIDDVKIYQIDQYVDTPVILPYSNYTGNSFNANWQASEGAESYLLNVYSLDENGKVVDFLTDKKVEGTSFTVSGIKSGDTYYYTVRAVKGIHESMETLPEEVFDLEAPKLNEASEVKDGKYTASWNEVPTAERYNYWAYNVRTADNDGEFAVTDENFDGIKDADGNETGLTIENPSYYSYDETYLNELNQAGWKGLNYMPYTDFICVDGWQYIYNHTDAGLISPELDLSKDNGKINLSVKLYGAVEIPVDETGNPDPSNPIQTEAAVALFNYDEEKGDFVQAELIYPEGVSPAWKTFNVTLTKGSKRSVIGIYAVKGADHLYIDDLKITQNYKKGESLTEPYLFKRYLDATSLDVDVPARVSGMPLYHKVSALKSKNTQGMVSYKESFFSDLQKVTDGTATMINDQMLKERASVSTDGQRLLISNPAGEHVSVYTPSGTQVFYDRSGRRYLTVAAAAHGLYIVKIGDTVVKVAN